MIRIQLASTVVVFALILGVLSGCKFSRPDDNGLASGGLIFDGLAEGDPTAHSGSDQHRGEVFPTDDGRFAQFNFKAAQYPAGVKPEVPIYEIYEGRDRETLIARFPSVEDPVKFQYEIPSPEEHRVLVFFCPRL